jgi:prepilin-type N-terminal cleavage/methylation domain-containing protein
VRRGFTIIELLVVIAISALLSTLAIVYSGQSRNEVALSVEAAKITQLILQAKQLAIATNTVGGGTLACGYGMYFDTVNSTYSLFIYSPKVKGPKGNCPPLGTAQSSKFDFSKDAVEYSSESWDVPVAQGLVLQSNTTNLPSAVAVIFFPPNPATLITNVSDDGKFSNTTSYVNVAIGDGSDVKNISITPAGQITE